jgi:hypothetical protein
LLKTTIKDMLIGMSLRRIVPVLILMPLLAAGACNTQSADNSATAPTTPTAPTITEPAFTGTLNVQGVPQILTFNVQQAGPITVTLNSAGPPSNVSVGVGLGTPVFGTTGTTCTPVLAANAVAGVSPPQLTGTVSSAGPYCLAVYDPGTLPATITFSVTVAHT